MGIVTMILQLLFGRQANKAFKDMQKNPDIRRERAKLDAAKSELNRVLSDPKLWKDRPDED